MSGAWFKVTVPGLTTVHEWMVLVVAGRVASENHMVATGTIWKEARAKWESWGWQVDMLDEEPRT